MEKIAFMGVGIDNVTLTEAMGRVEACVEAKQKMYVVTPNVDHIVKLQKDAAFRRAYAQAGLVTVDGSPIMKAAKWYGTPLKEKIPGPDLAEAAIRLAAEKGYAVFFLGAAPGVGEQAAKRMKEKYPGFRCTGTYSPPLGFEKDPEERQRIADLINKAVPEIMIAGMGSPKTEIFLMENYRDWNVRVSFSTGAAIDFLAGRVERCPRWVNRIGMEWFYRFLKEPRRLFKRYFIDDMAFLRLLFQYRSRQTGNGTRG